MAVVEAVAKVWIRPLGFAEATQVALNMRAADAAEIFACRFDDDSAGGRAGLALEVAAAVTARGLGWVAGLDRPIAAFGAVEQWPGHWGAFQFGTPDWPRVVRSVTRFARTTARAALLARGARRCEVRSAIWRTDAHRWLAALGAAREATHRDHGRDGSAYLTFAWTAGPPIGPASDPSPSHQEEATHVRLQLSQPAALAAAAPAAAGDR